MSESVHPESRIFRIGRECYIVYLGREQDDVRPFLRIGNMRDIPAEVLDVLSTTILSEDHVGNPLQEIQIAPGFHGRYIGDTSVVATMRRFFKSFDLPSDDITDYRKVRDGEGRYMAWFYSSGNIHLRYDDQVIFDLHKREKEDRHFIRLYEEAKSCFLHNPLRYIRQDFSGHGLIMTGRNVFWYENGELLSFTGRPGYITGLMNQGTDPDFITATASSLTQNDLASHEAAVFTGFIKHFRQRRRQLRILTAEPQLHRKIKLLFPARDDGPAGLEITDVSGQRKATFHESVISYSGKHWILRRTGIPEISIGRQNSKGLSVDFAGGRFVLNGRTEFQVPPGFPVEVTDAALPAHSLTEQYVTSVAASLKEHLSDQESAVFGALERYLSIAENHGPQSSHLKQSAKEVQSAAAHCTPVSGSPSWFCFSNALAVLETVVKPQDQDPGPVISALRGLAAKMDPPDPVLPFRGELYTAAPPCLLWMPTRRKFSLADIASSRKINQQISGISRLDGSEWKDNLERLLKLIRSLASGTSGALSAEQMKLLKSPQRPSAPARPVPPPVKQKVSRPVSAQPGPARPETSPPPPSKSEEPPPKPVVRKASASSGRRSGFRKSRLFLLIVPIAAGLIWFIAGRTQVNPADKPERPAITRRNSSQSDPSALPETSVDPVDADSRQPEAVSDDPSASDTSGSSGNDLPSDTDPSDQPDGSEPSASGTAGLTSGSGSTPETGSETTLETGSAPDAGTPANVSGSNPETSPEANLSSGTANAGASSAAQTNRSSEKETASPGNGTVQPVSSEADSAAAETNVPPDTIPAAVDPDEAPATPAEAEAYLDIYGRVTINEVDLHLAANEIAVLNGYKDLDYRVFTGADPDMIYPGRTLELPDDGTYTVRSGDTIWFLAAREVRVDTEHRLQQHDNAAAVLGRADSDSGERTQAVSVLENIAQDARSSDLRRMAENTLRTID